MPGLPAPRTLPSIEEPAPPAAGPVELSPTAPAVEELAQVLTPEALAFLGDLAGRFTHRVDALLDRRRERQRALDRGAVELNFLEETADIRAADWKVAPLPKDLLKRRVEITGPVSKKMVINALNSGADVFMADFEDATCPTFAGAVEGQANLMAAIRRTLAFHDDKKGKDYNLDDEVAVLMVRPRGWHLPELHVTHQGRALPASLFDAGLYLFHNAAELVERGSGPYLYLPKLESHLEARLWNDVLTVAEERLGLDVGTIKVTVLIETLPAAFEMEEILYELREHMAGLNCGRWDYIFSTIKTHRNDDSFLLPDRAQVGMTQHAMRSYTQLVIKTCHRRGAFAMGGMAAQIPLKDPDQNAAALEKVRADKLREVQDGHDGTWVAHPALVPVAMEVFDQHLEGPNQLHVTRDDVEVTAEDLLRKPEGALTEEGARVNLRVGVQYLEAWLRGSGCVPLYGLMEDAATAEISRAQLWQQVRHKARFTDGSVMTPERFQTLLNDEMNELKAEVGADAYAAGRYTDAAALFSQLICANQLAEFLTLPAYKQLVKEGC